MGRTAGKVFEMPNPVPTMEQAYATMMDAKVALTAAEAAAAGAPAKIDAAQIALVEAKSAKNDLKLAQAAHAYAKKVYVRVM